LDAGAKPADVAGAVGDLFGDEVAGVDVVDGFAEGDGQLEDPLTGEPVLRFA
jgi:hypothetical protein